MKIRALPWLALLALALGACAETPTADGDAPAPDGIDFGLAAGTAGAHYADRSLPAEGAPLAGEFAVAIPDSLGGLVLLSYDQETSDLFILQVAEMEIGTYGCGPVEEGSTCHARLFENVREEGGIVEVDGRLDLATGSLTLGGVGPDDVRGSFQAHFERSAGEGTPSIDVFHGTILVYLLEGPVESGGLACLVELAAGATDCS